MLLGDHGREFPTSRIHQHPFPLLFCRNRMKEFAKARIVVTLRQVQVVGCLLSFRKRTAVHIGIQYSNLHIVFGRLGNPLCGRNHVGELFFLVALAVLLVLLVCLLFLFGESFAMQLFEGARDFFAHEGFIRQDDPGFGGIFPLQEAAVAQFNRFQNDLGDFHLFGIVPLHVFVGVLGDQFAVMGVSGIVGIGFSLAKDHVVAPGTFDDFLVLSMVRVIQFDGPDHMDPRALSVEFDNSRGGDGKQIDGDAVAHHFVTMFGEFACVLWYDMV